MVERLTMTPDIPNVYNRYNDCNATPPVQLDLYLGDSFQWSVSNNWAGGNLPWIRRLSPYKEWYQSSSKTGSFTPPTIGCYQFIAALNAYYHADLYSSKWIILAIRVHAPLPAPFVDPLWSLQIGPV